MPVLHDLVCMVFIGGYGQVVDKLQHGYTIGTGHRYLVDEEENVRLLPDVEMPLKEQYHMFLHP